MKSVAQLNNVMRVKLLFELFPDATLGFLKFQLAVINILIRYCDQLRNTGTINALTFNFWIQVAKDIKKVIRKYGCQLSKRSRLLTNHWFDGYPALYATQCLHQYIAHQEPEDIRFVHAVKVLFK